MKNAPKVWFWLCKLAGFGLLFVRWLDSGDTAGFFLLLPLIVMTLLRWRIPKLWYTIAIDGVALWIFGQQLALGLCIVSEVFYRSWEAERRRGLNLRDSQAGRYYELESLQNDLAASLAQIERMTAVAERTRIARDIHDNAGHEIVAAYMSLQTARAMMDAENPDALELYDAALERLSSGTDKIRETVHNLSAVTSLGVETLQELCDRFPAPSVQFHVYGDTSKIPLYVWNMLEACLRECLTNVARHSMATHVSVDLDATPHIVRLCVENDGVAGTGGNPGSGLRNLRHRAAAIGGNLSIDAGDTTFRVICVIPLKEDRDETAHC